MPDVEEVSVRVHLRVHGWGGRLVKTPGGKKMENKLSGLLLLHIKLGFFSSSFFFS